MLLIRIKGNMEGKFSFHLILLFLFFYLLRICIFNNYVERGW